MDTFASVLVALVRDDVAFVVVGGLAVAKAGYARTTDDLDLIVEASHDNLERLIRVLSGVGEGAAAELGPDDFPVEEGAIRVSEDFDIDLFTQMSGLTYADMLQDAIVHDIEGTPVQFLGADALIRLKSASLRPRDRLDAEVLRSIQRGDAL